MESERLIYLIDQREDGHISPEETQELNQLLTLKEASSLEALHLSLRKELTTEGRHQLAGTLQSWEAEIANNQDNQGGRIIRFPLWSGLLAVAAVITVFLLVLLPDQQNPNSRLFQELAAPYPNVLYPLERGETTRTALEQAFAEYEAGHFETFLESLDQLDTTAASFEFYRAIALMQTERPTEAEPIFQELTKTESEFSDQAEWYLAMTLRSLNQGEAAEKLILQISQQADHEMYKRAIRWLEAE